MVAERFECSMTSLWLFLCLYLGFVSAKSATQVSLNLRDASLEQLQIALIRGSLTSVDLVNAYNERISEVNSVLHAVTELNPDALAIARTLDKERQHGHIRGPLHGLPVIIKGNIATDDLMNTTAGSYALLGAKSPDATVAAKLRRAGAILLGKANLSQWANFRSDNSSNGWSAYGGQTYGSYYPNQDPSGSSSGSGVAADQGLAWACLGTETDGSVISPSEVNNIVGIKPTVGLTSRFLVVPISEHQDTVGAMAHSVRDAAWLLSAIAGPDPNDNYTSAIPHPFLPDYVAACQYESLSGKRFGVPRNVIDLFMDNTTDPILAAFEASLGTIRAAGATIVDSNFTALEEWANSNNETIVLDTDFINNLATYLSHLTFNPRKVMDLADVDAFTKAFPLEEYPSRDVAVWEQSLGLGYNNSDYRAYQARQADLYLGGPGGVLGAIHRGSLDAVLLPSAFSPPFAAIVGSPVVTVPMGSYPADTPVQLNSRGNLVATAPNIPFGLSFMGSKWSEADLIGFAYAFEQRTHARANIKPYIQPATQCGPCHQPSWADGGGQGCMVQDPSSAAKNQHMFQKWIQEAGLKSKTTKKSKGKPWGSPAV